MEAYIVVQPVMNKEHRTAGCGIVYSGEEDGAEAVCGFLSSPDIEIYTGNKKLFVTFTEEMLVKNIPRGFDPDGLVIQLEDSLLANPRAHSLITRFRQSGYQTAVIDFEFSPKYFGIMDIVDYIKVDFRNYSDPSIEKTIRIAKSFGKKIIAYNVECAEAYDKAGFFGCAYFQGSFVSEKMPAFLQKSKDAQRRFFALLAEITREETDIDGLEKIISDDPYLVSSVLRLANSAYFDLHVRVTAVKQAIAVIGPERFRQWIYMIYFRTSGGDGMPDELIRLSYLRGAFCAELSEFADDISLSRSSAYFMGMISLSGRLMQTRLSEILSHIFISDNIKTALSYREGKAGMLYALALFYERAEWDRVTRLANELGIPSEIISGKYLECLKTVNSEWKLLTRDGSAAE